MVAKVIPIGCLTSLDVPVDTVLENAMEQLEGCVLMGWDKDGDLYFASTYADGGTVLWLMEQCKTRLLNVEID